jgi:hypothetical protein
MFYVLVKFVNHPEPVIMPTMDIRHGSWLSTMNEVEWVSPTIANGNALSYHTEVGGEVLDGVHGQYISAYRPQLPAPARQDQEELARQAINWETAEITARKFGFSAE